jgi:hypothetical protein
MRSIGANILVGVDVVVVVGTVSGKLKEEGNWTPGSTETRPMTSLTLCSHRKIKNSTDGIPPSPEGRGYREAVGEG